MIKNGFSTNYKAMIRTKIFKKDLLKTKVMLNFDSRL